MKSKNSIRFTPGKDDAGPENIAAKVAQVMGHLSSLDMNGTNTYHNYRYLTIGQIAEALRPLLANANLAIIPALVRVEPIVKDNTEKGVTAHVDFTLVCGDTGAMLTSRWQGEAFDSQDKAINKAIRAAQKYYLLVTFDISDSAESEADGDQGVAGSRKPRRQPAPKSNNSKCPTCLATGNAHAPWCQEVDGQRVDTRQVETHQVDTRQKKAKPKPAPKPNGNDKPKRASVRTSNWTQAATTLAAEVPHYQENGQTNFHHLTGAAAKLGYNEITDQNLDEVLEALRGYALDQHALQAAESAESLDDHFPRDGDQE